MFEETEAYPLEEMVNELTGIFGLYFGFSVLSLASLCNFVFEKVHVTYQKKTYAGDAINSIR